MKKIQMTLKEYNERLKKDEPAFRSCWNCNSAHNHLKKANYLIWCFECGKLYLKGKEVEIIYEENGEDNETNNMQ